MNYSFHPEAEFLYAIDYYEECEANLGVDFALEVHFAIERIIAYPKSWSVVVDKIRRSLVKRFPFGILYIENENGIYILAVMHLHREPNYWQDRKK